MDEYVRFLRSGVGHALIVAPVAGAAVRDARGWLLLQQRAEEGTWGLPGGWVRPGESAAECARREVLEETGWAVEVTGLLGVYTAPGPNTYTYPSGDRVQLFSVIVEAVALRREGDPDGETRALGFFAPDALPSPLHGPDGAAIADFASALPRPFLR